MLGEAELDQKKKSNGRRPSTLERSPDGPNATKTAKGSDRQLRRRATTLRSTVAVRSAAILCHRVVPLSRDAATKWRGRWSLPWSPDWSPRPRRSRGRRRCASSIAGPSSWNRYVATEFYRVSPAIVFVFALPSALSGERGQALGSMGGVDRLAAAPGAIAPPPYRVFVT